VKMIIEVPESYRAHAGAFATWVSGRFANDEPPTIALFPGMVMPLTSFRLLHSDELVACTCCIDNQCGCGGREVT
jgi:hypothetical protein